MNGDETGGSHPLTFFARRAPAIRGIGSQYLGVSWTSPTAPAQAEATPATTDTHIAKSIAQLAP